MQTTTSLPTVARVALGLLALGSFAAGSVRAQAVGSLADEYRFFVQLGEEPRYREAMERQYVKLSRLAPNDAEVPYTHALILTGQRRYEDAARSTARTIALGGGGLDAWKLHIWLQLKNEKFVDALKYVEQLAERMPADDATGGRRLRGEQMAEYFGTVVGYLGGPREKDFPAYNLAKHEQNIRSMLTYSQDQAFQRGSDRVRAVYASKAERIDRERQNEYGSDLAGRESLYGQMAAERERVQNELDKLEALRLKSQELASSERNTIAATRERLSEGMVSSSTEGELNRRRTRGPFGFREREVNGYGRSDFTAGETNYSRGLGDDAYESVETRREDYDEYLAGKEADLRRQLQVMERKELAIRDRPVTGSSPRVARLERKAKLLSGYLALPVDPEAKLRDLLVELQRYQPAGEVAEVLAP